MNEPGRLFSIDYLIGEEDFLGKGHGKAIVRALVEMIRRRDGAQRIVVQPDPENIPSNKMLEATGFLYEEKKQYYYYDL